MGEECLIPLKARAWLDLTKRKANGDRVDSKNIRKHRNDILRLYQLLTPGRHIDMPETVKKDLKDCLLAVEPELTPRILKDLNISEASVATVMNTIKTVYGIAD